MAGSAVRPLVGEGGRALLWGVVVYAVIEGGNVGAPGVVVAIAVVVVILLAFAIDYWRLHSTMFPQWFYDRPHIDIEVGSSGDYFSTQDWLQGPYFYVKNRKVRGRKTDAARDLWFHAVFEGPEDRFEPQLRINWTTTPGRPETTCDLPAGIATSIALVAKGIKQPPNTEGHFQLAGVEKDLDFFKPYLMDDRFWQTSAVIPPRVLKVGVYDIAIWAEYGGGHMTRRRHFQLVIPKGDGDAVLLRDVPTTQGAR